MQWLIDTPERLRAYLTLAETSQTALRLSLEVDIGLHRGGLKVDQVAELARVILSHPNARLSGLMGYEAHLAKLPGVLKSRASEGQRQSV